MKGSSAGLLASVLTASTVALSSCSISTGEHDVASDRSYIQRSRWSSSTEENERGSFEKEKFAPRFDGMRFIETLITAHR